MQLTDQPYSLEKVDGCLNADPNLADWSMQLLVRPVFFLAVWFPLRDKAAGAEQTTGLLKGTGPMSLN